VLDVHKEAGPLTVVLPSEQGELSLYASQGSDPKAHSRAFVLQADDGALTLRDAPIELARGGMFGELFSAPFGPRAFGEFSRRERPDVPEVFGLTEADTVRAGYYMQEIAAASRRSRLRRVACFFALEYAPLGGILAEARHRHRPWVLGVEGGVGAALLGAAFYDLFVPSSGEKMFSSLHGELLKGPDVAREAFLRTEPELIRWQRQLQRRRRILGVLPFALGVTSGVVALAEAESKAAQHSPSVHNVLPVLGVGAIALGAAIGIWQLLVPSAEERLIGMLRRDPQLSMQLGATASNRGGGLALRGAF
jgi:hypothetical protein